jgi:hypothetical protein
MKTPAACRSNACPYTDLAWADWTSPPPAAIDEPSIQLLDDLADWRRAKEAESYGKRVANTALEQRKAIEQRLIGEYLLPEGDSTVGDLFNVRRTPVRGRETFSWRKAKTAGAISPHMEELLSPFLKTSSGYDIFQVERVEGKPLSEIDPDAYGDVPF